MAYTFPTSQDFYDKFPELEDELPDDEVDDLLAEAGRSVDTTWTEGDYANAILYLAAHNRQVFLDAQDAPGGQEITAEHIGPISVSYGKSGSVSKDSSPYETTSYGKKYFSLLKKNIPAVLVI